MTIPALTLKHPFPNTAALHTPIPSRADIASLVAAAHVRLASRPGVSR